MNRQRGDWLHEALADLESSAPIAAPPRPGRVGASRRWPVAAAAATLPLAIAGGILLARIVAPPPVGESTPTPATSSAPTTSPSASATSSTTPSPTPIPSAADPTPPTFSVTWDAAAWSEQTVPESVAYDRATATWLAVGAGAWISDDGLTWLPVPFEAPPCPFDECTQAWALDLVPIGDDWIAVGQIGGRGSDAARLVAWRSTDGRSWEVVADPMEPTAQRAAAAVQGATILVASTALTDPEAFGIVHVSQDGGATWVTSQPVLGNTWDAYGDEDGFLVVGARLRNASEPDFAFYEPFIAGSHDGFTWTWATGAGGLPAETGTVRAIERTADGLYVASGVSMDGRAFVWTSRDRLTWSESVLSEPSDELLPGISFKTSFLATDGTAVLLLVSFDDGFGASTSGTAAWVSRDGITWESSDLPDLPSGSPARATTIGSGAGAAVVFGTMYFYDEGDVPERIVWRARIIGAQ